MTEEERDEMMRSNWKAQLAALGYGPDGMALPREKTYGWISVKDRMPESKTCVLVTVKTRNGKHVVMIACHVNAREVDSEDYEWQDAEIDWDYDEENDIYWVPECWYEGNFVEENTSWIIDEYADGIVTHWMPLPEPAKEDV